MSRVSPAPTETGGADSTAEPRRQTRGEGSRRLAKWKLPFFTEDTVVLNLCMHRSGTGCAAPWAFYDADETRPVSDSAPQLRTGSRIEDRRDSWLLAFTIVMDAAANSLIVFSLL